MKKLTLVIALALGISGQIMAQVPGVRGSKSGSASNAASSVMRKHNLPVTAAVIYSDDCNSSNTLVDLVGRGYEIYNLGTGPAGTADPFFQGNPAVFTSYNGPDSGYISANFQVVTGTNDIDSWLVLPAQNLALGDSLAFFQRAPDSQTIYYADSMRVMYNPTNNPDPADPNWVELGRFQVDTAGWARRSYAVPTASTTGLFAIRYAVVEGGPSGANSNFVGIDAIVIFNNVSSGNFDDCADAVDINSGFGSAIGTVNTLGPYDNSTATTGPLDPTVGWECFGEPNGSGSAPELNNTVWFTFTGDGNNYFVESGTCAGVTNYIDDGDTQFALYTGSSCTNLTPIKCNEDGPSSGPGGAPPYPAGFTFGTTVGQTYYLMVDGFSFNGAVSTGEFCLLISRVASVACGDPAVSVGTTTVNDTILCPGDTVNITVAGAVAPNQGSFYGISMVVTTAPITALSNPLNSDPAFVAAYGFVEPVPPSFLRRYINDGSLIDGVNLPYGTYYWTPVIFGNATPDPASPQTVFLSDLVLDLTCTVLGPSIAVQVLDGTDPLCQTSGVGEVKGQTYGITNLFPVPVRGQLNFVYNSAVTETVQVEIKDQLGRAVKSFSMDVRSGKNDLQSDMGGISSGIYFLSVSGKNAVYNTRFTKE